MIVTCFWPLGLGFIMTISHTDDEDDDDDAVFREKKLNYLNGFFIASLIGGLWFESRFCLFNQRNFCFPEKFSKILIFQLSLRLL